MSFQRFLMVFLACGALVFADVSSARAQDDDDRERSEENEFVFEEEEETSGSLDYFSMGYESPSFDNLAKSLVALDYYDLNDDAFIDEYAQTFYCDIYEGFFKDDFQWAKIRDDLRVAIKEHRKSFPRRYDVIGPIFLDRYDFEKEAFELADKSKMERVGLLTILNVPPNRECDRAGYQPYFPSQYIAQLNQPITIKYLRIPKDDARALMRRMKMNQYAEGERMIYVRFRMTLLAVRKITGYSNKREAVIHASLEDVSFFEDQDMKYFIVQGPSLN